MKFYNVLWSSNGIYRREGAGPLTRVSTAPKSWHPPLVAELVYVECWHQVRGSCITVVQLFNWTITIRHGGGTHSVSFRRDDDGCGLGSDLLHPYAETTIKGNKYTVYISLWA
jgi:hypothetical protein